MKRILVVDDSEFFREIYKTDLEQGGYEVETAENGKIAIEKMLANPPQLVFLDFVMPEMNGEEVLREKQKHDEIKDVPVVMLTSISAELEGAKIMNAGPIVAYMTKDKVGTADLLNRAKEVLGE